MSDVGGTRKGVHMCAEGNLELKTSFFSFKVTGSVCNPFQKEKLGY